MPLTPCNDQNHGSLNRVERPLFFKLILCISFSRNLMRNINIINQTRALCFRSARTRGRIMINYLNLFCQTFLLIYLFIYFNTIEYHKGYTEKTQNLLVFPDNWISKEEILIKKRGQKWRSLYPVGSVQSFFCYYRYYISSK